MDNKITKKRIKDMLSYNWIFIAVILTAIIIVFEFIFNLVGVVPTVGQTFKFYTDVGVSSETMTDVYNKMVKNGVFSFDILSVEYEKNDSVAEQMFYRLSVQDGDVVVSNIVGITEEDADVRANKLIDDKRSYFIMPLDKFNQDGKNYLSGFLKDGEQDCFDFSKLDKSKIEDNFRTRMKKDNRFRDKENFNNGLEQEYLRIAKLCVDLKDFNYLMEERQDLFYNYTRYTQLSKKQSEYSEALMNETKRPYGLLLGKLTGGQENVTSYFRDETNGSAEELVLMVFDFTEQQKDLQYESVSFIMEIVKNCSDIDLPSKISD